MTALERKLQSSAVRCWNDRVERDGLIREAAKAEIPYRRIAELVGVSLGQVSKIVRAR